MSTKAERARAAEEQAQAIEELREMFPPGSRVSVSIGYVARSGMLRTVKVYRSNADGSLDGVTWMVACDAGRTGALGQGVGTRYAARAAATSTRPPPIHSSPNTLTRG